MEKKDDAEIIQVTESNATDVDPSKKVETDSTGSGNAPTDIVEDSPDKETQKIAQLSEVQSPSEPSTSPVQDSQPVEATAAASSEQISDPVPAPIVETKPEPEKPSISQLEQASEALPVSVVQEAQPNLVSDLPIETKIEPLLESKEEPAPQSVVQPEPVVETKPELEEAKPQAEPVPEPTESQPEPVPEPAEPQTGQVPQPTESQPELAASPVESKSEAIPDPVESQPEKVLEPAVEVECVESKPEVVPESPVEVQRESVEESAVVMQPETVENKPDPVPEPAVEAKQEPVLDETQPQPEVAAQPEPVVEAESTIEHQSESVKVSATPDAVVETQPEAVIETQPEAADEIQSVPEPVVEAQSGAPNEIQSAIEPVEVQPKSEDVENAKVEPNVEAPSEKQPIVADAQSVQTEEKPSSEGSSNLAEAAVSNSNADERLNEPVTEAVMNNHVQVNGSENEAMPNGQLESSKAVTNGEISENGPSEKATLIMWNHGGQEVAVCGDFCKWEDSCALSNIDGVFSTKIKLAHGEHHIKFLVDGKWTVDETFPVVELEDHGQVNLLVVPSTSE